MGRALRTGAELRKLFDPKSICVVGASDKPGNFGLLTVENLADFRGTVTAVNPRLREVGGKPCYPSLKEVPEVPDCVVLCTPKQTVADLLEEAAALGVGGAVVYASGFAEMDEEGARQQARIAEIADRTGIRVMGPNCLGYVNNVSRALATFSPKAIQAPALRGGVGMVSQSGALRDVFLQAPRRGMGFSHLLAAGNSADLDVWDMVSFLLDDEATRTVALLFEGVSDGEKLQALGRRAREAGKVIVACNAATGERSKQAAKSHTGAMASADEVVQAALDRAGFVTVKNLEDLCPMAAFFAKAPDRPSGPGAFQLSTSGGACVIAAAKAEEAGAPMPPPKEETAARLRAVMPDFVQPANPCDLTAMTIANPNNLVEAVNAFMNDPDFACGAFSFPTYVPESSENRARLLAQVAEEHPDRALALVWMTEWGEAPAALIAEQSKRLALFQSMRQCMEAFAAFLSRGRQDEPAARLSEPRHVEKPSWPMDEAGAKRVLADYGLPVTGEVLARTADEAWEAARGMGRVAMKVSSPHIAHKTEVGGVRLGLSSEAEVREAFAALEAVTRANAPEFEHVLVQEMLPPGVEIIVGGFVHPVFGPVVSVGAGGVNAEVFQDLKLALAPVGMAEARRMVDGLKCRKLLDGLRGAAPSDKEAVAEAVVRASELLADAKGWMAELDVNPLIAAPGRTAAADALIVPA